MSKKDDAPNQEDLGVAATAQPYYVDIKLEIWQEASAPPEGFFDDDWLYIDEDAELSQRDEHECSFCNGSGRDPYSDYLLQCNHCDGEGVLWWRL